MRGAPELAPEDIGNVTKFNEFLQRHATYAAAAREQGQSWASVAGLLARYADDLAVAFNACALKRNEQPVFEANTVLQLTDDQFERLYLEACAPSVEYPSQVLELLEAVPFIRQQQHETSPMPALLRAAEAFRVQLRLLPVRAVSGCKPDALAMSFMTLLFGQAAKHRSNDFQHCTTWDQLKNALIQCAASTPMWFGSALYESAPTASSPDKVQSKPAASVESLSSSGHTSTTSSTGDQRRMAERVAKLRESGDLKGLDIEGMSDKQILKVYNKARWRTKIGEEAIEHAKLDSASLRARLDEQAKMLATLTQQLRSRSDSRDRPYDRQHDERSREDRTRDSRTREDRPRDDRPRHNHSQDRPRSQEPPAPQNTSTAEQSSRIQHPSAISTSSQRQPSPGGTSSRRVQ
jgi:hypothetical protein